MILERKGEDRRGQRGEERRGEERRGEERRGEERRGEERRGEERRGEERRGRERKAVVIRRNTAMGESCTFLSQNEILLRSAAIFSFNPMVNALTERRVFTACFSIPSRGCRS